MSPAAPPPLFRRHDAVARPPITLLVDGEPVSARAGDTVAAALLAAGHAAFRHAPVSGAARGPWCLMGACFDCVVTIDGAPERQACLVEAREGMRVDLGLAHPPAPGLEDGPDPWGLGA